MRTAGQIEIAMSRDFLEDYVVGTTSADGAASGLSVVTTSNSILREAGKGWVNYMLEVTSGDRDTQERLVDDFDVDSGVGTFTPKNGYTGVVESGQTFRLHRLPIARKYEAITRALKTAGTLIPRHITEEFLSGQLLKNGNWELWDNDISYDWTTISGTVTRETTEVYQGIASLGLKGLTSSFRQKIILEREFSGQTATFTAWVKGKIANAPALQITANGTTTSSDTVAADDTWEELSVSVAIADAIRPIYVGGYNNNNSELAYFDGGHLSGASLTTGSLIARSTALLDISELQHIPSSESDFVNYVRVPGMWRDGYGVLRDALTDGQPIRLIGTGLWNRIEDGDTEVDIEFEQEPLVAVRAARHLMENAQTGELLSETPHWAVTEQRVRARETELTQQLTPQRKHKLLSQYYRD